VQRYDKEETTHMKRLISGMALAAALGSLAPLAAGAAESSTTQATAGNAIVAPGASFEIVDETTGQVLGQLISVGSNTQVIAAMADRARAQQRAQVEPKAKAEPKTAQEWQDFWSSVLSSGRD
jgi:hypothetical protein